MLKIKKYGKYMSTRVNVIEEVTTPQHEDIKPLRGGQKENDFNLHE